MAVNGNGKGGGGGGKIRAGRAYVELSAEDAGLRKALDKARAMVMKFGKATAGIGAGLLGTGGGVLGGLSAGLGKVLERNSEITRLAQKLGVSTEQLSQFAYAAETTGMSFEDLTGQFENLAERVSQGANGAGEAAETFKKLGIDAAQLKLKNPIDQMIELAGAMQGVTNQTERLGMLSSLGGDQFQWMENLFARGPEGIRALMGEAQNVGASLDSNVAKQSQKTSQAFNRAWASIKNAVLSVSSALLDNAETIEWVTSGIVNIAKAVRNFINDNKRLIGIVAAVAAGIAAVGGILLSVGLGLAAAATAASGLVAAFSAIGSVVAAVFTPVGAIVAGVVVVVAALAAGVVYLGKMFLENTEMGRNLASSIGAAFRYLLDIFKTTWGGIVDAIRSGDLRLAWDIAVAGITVVWKTAMVGLQEMWNKFKDYVVDGAFELKRQLQLILPDTISGTREEIDAASRENLEARRAAREADKQAAIAEVQQARDRLNALVAQAAVQANKPAVGAAAPASSGSEIARFMGGARGTFSAPDYRQFFGANGIEQKQLNAQLRAANALEKIEKKVGPLVHT
mgnify:CR=1 FL=1